VTVCPADLQDAIATATIWKEARGAGYRVKLGIAYTIRHRTKDSRWPITPAAVCLQDQQFSCWNGSDPNRIKFPSTEDQTLLDCYYAWKVSALDTGPDPTHGANHYHGDSIPDATIARQWKLTVDELLAARTATIENIHFYAL